MKIVINAKFGGFGMSEEAIELYKSYITSKDPTMVFTDSFFNQRKGSDVAHLSQRFLKEEAAITKEQSTERKEDPENDIGMRIPRYDPCLVRVVEELGRTAGPSYSNLTVVDIPDGIDWVIEEYDGYEWVSERHKIFTYYPLHPDILIHGRGMQSEGLYDPNKENGFKNDKPSEKSDHCFLQ
jgi:hypothetical protein